MACTSDCSRAISEEFLGHGDACAQYGVDYMNCLSSASCNDLNNGYAGTRDPNSMAINSACSSGGTSSSSQPTTDTVNCSSGGGSAAAGDVTIGASVCDSNLSDCSDGHSYRVNCLYAGNNQMTCVCYRDGAVQNTFVAALPDCPNVQIANADCGWQLSAL